MTKFIKSEQEYYKPEIKKNMNEWLRKMLIEIFIF